jgi:anti-sigma factor RsiW
MEPDMNCETVEHNLRAYLDEELTASLKTGLAGHLSGCPACTQKLALLKDTKALFQKLGPRTTTTDFEPQLNEKLRKLDIRMSTHSFIRFFLDKLLPYKSPVLAPAAGLAAILILAAVIAVNLRNQRGADNFVESYFTDRSPYCQALTDKHDIFTNDNQIAGTDRCTWSGCAGRS